VKRGEARRQKKGWMKKEGQKKGLERKGGQKRKGRDNGR